MSGSADERRTSQRVEALVLVQLDKDGRHGVTRDVSERGLLIATQYRFSVGDRLEITIRATAGAIQTTARVVRVDATPPSEAWRYRVALELGDAVPDTIVADGAAVAAELVGRGSSRPPPRPPTIPPPKG